ncbi:MAG: mechanosensitive ion channel family protein [Phycisphaerales bacterium]|jgi:small-conductance mechanosensitive channel|nr:mechanosensitive ion channel family protein [Phycisphaerales bacterium]
MPNLGALEDWLPFLVVLAISSASLGLYLRVGRFARRKYGMERRLPIQMSGAAGALVAIIALAVLLPTHSEGPLTESAKSQLLSLIGVALVATLTLSSTTLAANVLAGWMLRAVGSFRSGDFIRAGEHFGRVTERGLFHVEIQTEERDLVTLPNLFIATNPVRVVRSSGTLITAEVSLGYDVPHANVEKALQEAALTSGLSDAYVLVVNLLDHAVVYRVCGFLEDPRTLVSSRSALRAAMLDALHGHDIEIVSPGFVFQRRVDADQRVIPVHVAAVASESPAIEDVAFDKAQEAEDVEKLRTDIGTMEARVGELRKSDPECAELATTEQELDDLRRQLEEHEQGAEQKDQAKAKQEG